MNPRWRSARRIAAFLLAAAAVLTCSARRPSAVTPPSIVLVSIDTLRADHLGCYGYSRPTSPFIDTLAREGVLFEQAYSPSSWTLPAHASMLSGVTPYRHGATDATRRIRDDVTLLAQRLKGRGYETAGIVNAPFVGARYGFSRGFDTYIDGRQETKADHVAYQALVLGLIRSLKKPPFFLFIHYMDVHSPYTPPAAFNRFTARGGAAPRVDGWRMADLDVSLRKGEVTLTATDRDYLVALYDGEILAMDDTLRETVSVLRREVPGDVVVLLTADHGEEFLEHGGVTHGRTLYDEVLHVPLIVAGPGVASGRRVSGLVSLLDIFPTVVEWANAGPAIGVEGRSLLGELRSGSGLDAPKALLPLHTWSHNGGVRLRGFRTPAAKLIADDITGARQFYDLPHDPGERTSRLSLSEAERLTRLLAGLRLQPSDARSLPSATELEVLRALGYQ